MNIYSIADLHFSFFKEKKMNCFGKLWENHFDKIKKFWIKFVNHEDIVLLPGDFSWAMNLEEVKSDFEFLYKLPGKKVFIKGNHDFWWKSISKVRENFSKNCYFIQNDILEIEEFVFSGTRGWILPEDNIKLDIKNKKIYNRELIRLEKSLMMINRKEKKRIIAMMHYPPISKNGENTGFSNLLKKYSVKICVYGHIHNDFDKRKLLSGKLDEIMYHLVSSDYLKFKIKKIL